MNLAKDSIKKIYFKYLFSCLGSAMILSIYTLVDTIVVGQYEGPDGTAAIATINPFWAITFSIGILFGVGGSVWMSTARGEGNLEEGNRYYTTSSILISAVMAVVWLGVLIFEQPLLRFFGADDTILPMAHEYMRYVKLVFPLFAFGEFYGAFVRNDGNPMLASSAIIAGGIFNIVGDIVLVFGFDMGIRGAGIATALGQTLATVIMLCHHFSAKKKLHFVRPANFLVRAKKIVTSGLSTFSVDLAVGVLNILLNRQIMRYYDSTVLAIYGVAAIITILIQSIIYGVGNAAQPIISINYGAKKEDRIRQTLRLSLGTVTVIGTISILVTELFPVQIMRIFMNVTPRALEIAPGILRIYFISCFFLGYNVFFTYYFQAVMQNKASLFISFGRGIVLSGILVLVLPAVFGAAAIWWALPVAEICIAVWSFWYLRHSRRHG